MDLSIIVPAYNEEMHIEKTLNSLLSILSAENIQFEIIVVNDNCQEKCHGCVEHHGKYAPFPRRLTGDADDRNKTGGVEHHKDNHR